MAFNRRRFIKKVSEIGALSTWSLPVLGTNQILDQDKDATNAFLAGPYLQNLGPDQVTIMWITNKNCLSWVEYGSGNYLNLMVYGLQNGLIQAHNRINKITLKNLKPGTPYKYRIVSEAILDYQASKVEFDKPLQSAMYTFKTPATDEEGFKFVILNDIHDRPQTIPQLLYKYGYQGNTRDFDAAYRMFGSSFC